MLERIAFALVAEAVAGTAAAGAGRVAGLDHEVVDHAMELHAVVEALSGEKHEVVDRLRRVLGIELELDRAAIRLDRHRVVLLRVDLHFGRGLHCFSDIRYSFPLGTAATIPELHPLKLRALDSFADDRNGLLVELAQQLADEPCLAPLRAEARQPPSLGDGFA